jgi:hypothetical protein
MKMQIRDVDREASIPGNAEKRRPRKDRPGGTGHEATGPEAAAQPPITI